MKKSDIILLCSILIISGLVLLTMTLIFSDKGDTVIVTVDGEEYLRLPLNTDAEVTIDGYSGGHNILVIKDGNAYIKDADCPDKICQKSGNADSIRSIVCAPNRVVVSIQTDQ